MSDDKKLPNLHTIWGREDEIVREAQAGVKIAAFVVFAMLLACAACGIWLVG